MVVVIEEMMVAVMRKVVAMETGVMQVVVMMIMVWS